MSIKNLFAGLIVIGMLIFLFATPTGQKYIETITSNFIKILKIFPQFDQKENLSMFKITAFINREAIYNNSFEIFNSTFFAKGECIGKIRLEQILRETKNLTCEIVAEVKNGKIEINHEGFLFFDGNVKRIFIDNTQYESFDILSTSFALFPTSLKFWVKEDLKFLSNGTINKIVKNRIDQTKYLNNETFEILGFEGSLSMDEKILKIEGWANLVKGESFEFK